MISEKGISGNATQVRSMDFEYLRTSGIKHIQQLAGQVWTDYNLHDPGVTILEVLCYALTDISYRTEHLRDVFRSNLPVAESFLEKTLYGYESLIPSLPVTSKDLEDFIETRHESVIAAWVNIYPLIVESDMVYGGYEVSVYLKENPKYSDLNSDAIEVIPDGKRTRFQVILFDESNARLPWDQINEIKGCRLYPRASEPFFQFEKHNGQVPLELDLKWSRKRTFEKVNVKARVAISGIDKPLSKHSSISRYKDSILKVLQSKDFLRALRESLEKEHYKRALLNTIRQTLLPVRSLCEDFTELRVVNLQEIKIHMLITLNPTAPDNETMLQRVYDALDTFVLSLVTLSKIPEQRDKKQILYTSNIIEELSGIAGIRAVQIEALNLFVDGIPTISLQDEGFYDCLHLQNFARYVPKISREKSVVTFIRHGISQTLRPSEVSYPFTPRSLGQYVSEEDVMERISPPKTNFDETFFDVLSTYFSIQDDFPQNYGLTSGKLPKNASEEARAQQRKFKSYLLFFECILLDYTQRLTKLTDQLSLKQEETLENPDLYGVLSDNLADVKNLDLILDLGNTSAFDAQEVWQKQLEHKNRILDHLLARFGICYKNLEARSGPASSDHVYAKMRLLKDIPMITRSRALGLPLDKKVTKIWKGDILSGFQKRVYRLLGIGDKVLLNEKLSATKGAEARGFYLIEHRLLVQRTEYDVFDKKLNKASSLLIDFIRDMGNEEDNDFQFSFVLTILIPNWYSNWKGHREAYENILKEELPAHILPNIHWLNKKSLKGFEILYEDWLKALFQVYTE